MKVSLSETQWLRVLDHMTENGVPKETRDIVRSAFSITPRPKWNCQRITPELTRKIRRLVDDGLSLREVGRRVGRCHATVRLALSRIEQLR